MKNDERRKIAIELYMSGVKIKDIAERIHGCHNLIIRRNDYANVLFYQGVSHPDGLKSDPVCREVLHQHRHLAQLGAGCEPMPGVCAVPVRPGDSLRSEIWGAAGF